MENNIPTAEEFCKQKHNEIDPRTSWIDFNKEVMIEFAKLHVEAALKSASENVDLLTMNKRFSDDDLESSILNSYPLTNIK